MKEIVGRLEMDQAQVLAHIVNCQGAMGRGVALALTKEFPGLKQYYQVKVGMAYDKKALLGTCDIFKFDCKYVANLFAQFNYGTKERQINYEALYTSLEDLRRFMDDEKLISIAFPRGMGSGLAGGSWDIVLSMITHFFDQYDLRIIGLKG
jgi:O-acetyl-ADP-ribose deacetylase (regulator of RNase III)